MRELTLAGAAPDLRMRAPCHAGDYRTPALALGRLVEAPANLVPRVRPARETDAEPATSLLYESAVGMYDRFAGGRERALRLLQQAFARGGTPASVEVVRVAELEGRVVAVLSAFPVEEMPGRSGSFLRLSLRGLPPWRWPGCLRLYYAGMRASPAPPPGALYVDALATDADARRRGAARALLREAERQARELRLSTISLDTSLENRAARALYVGQGFEEVAYRPAARGLPGFVALVKQL